METVIDQDGEPLPTFEGDQAPETLEELDELANGDDQIIGGGEDDELNLDNIDDAYDVTVTPDQNEDGTFEDSGTITITDPDTGEVIEEYTYDDVETVIDQDGNIVPCLVAGTLIETDRGMVLVEDLKEGDLVLTADNGYKPIKWIGSRSVPGRGKYAPIRIKAGTLGTTRDLRVSPLHRMVVSGLEAELYFGDPEVFVPAKFLVNGDTIFTEECADVTYFHILFDSHEVIYAEGAMTESFPPGQQGLGNFSAETREEILSLFPELRVEDVTQVIGQTARPVVKKHEAKLLVA